jgi:hypothetical protein
MSESTSAKVESNSTNRPEVDLFSLPSEADDLIPSVMQVVGVQPAYIVIVGTAGADRLSVTAIAGKKPETEFIEFMNRNLEGYVVLSDDSKA